MLHEVNTEGSHVSTNYICNYTSIDCVKNMCIYKYDFITKTTFDLTTHLQQIHIKYIFE